MFLLGNEYGWDTISLYYSFNISLWNGFKASFDWRNIKSRINDRTFTWKLILLSWRLWITILLSCCFTIDFFTLLDSIYSSYWCSKTFNENAKRYLYDYGKILLIFFLLETGLLENDEIMEEFIDEMEKINVEDSSIKGFRCMKNYKIFVHFSMIFLTASGFLFLDSTFAVYLTN